MSDEKLGAYVVDRHSKMTAGLENWKRHWEDVAQYIIPRKDDMYGMPYATKGQQKHNLLYDATSIHSNELMASALHGMLTNPSSTWFGLSTGDPLLDAIPEVRAWLQKSADKIIQILNNSNFQTEIHEIYLDLGSFGTAVLRIEEDDDVVVRFHARPIYNTRVDENYKGIIDTVSYEYEMTLRQMKQQFGETFFDEKMKQNLIADPSKRETVIHLVEPRADRPFNGKGPTNMAFASYHVHKESKKVLKEGGFQENPYAIPRWTKIAGEMYGRSPGMKALPDIKMVNKMKKATIEAAQIAVAPPLQVPDDGVLLPVKIAPSSVNYYRAGTKDRIEPLVSGVRVDIGESMMDTVRSQIRQAFFIDQLQLVENDRMTATEVMQRRDEQLRLLGPILGRQHFELLKPLIDRVFGILLRKNLLEQPPKELSGVDLEVRYTSQIAKAQRSVDAENAMRAVQMATPFVEVNPDVMDNFNADAFVRYGADIYGLPESLMTHPKQMEQMRQGRQEAAQQQQQMEQAQGEADIAQTMAGAAAQDQQTEA